MKLGSPITTLALLALAMCPGACALEDFVIIGTDRDHGGGDERIEEIVYDRGDEDDYEDAEKILKPKAAREIFAFSQEDYGLPYIQKAVYAHLKPGDQWLNWASRDLKALPAERRAIRAWFERDRLSHEADRIPGTDIPDIYNVNGIEAEKAQAHDIFAGLKSRGVRSIAHVYFDSEVREHWGDMNLDFAHRPRFNRRERFTLVAAMPQWDQVIQPDLNPWTADDIINNEGEAREVFGRIQSRRMGEGIYDGTVSVMLEYFDASYSNYSSNLVPKKHAVRGGSGRRWFLDDNGFPGGHASVVAYGGVVNGAKGFVPPLNGFDSVLRDVNHVRATAQSGRPVDVWIAPYSWAGGSHNRAQRSVFWDDLVTHTLLVAAVTGGYPLYWDEDGTKADAEKLNAILAEFNARDISTATLISTELTGYKVTEIMTTVGWPDGQTLSYVTREDGSDGWIESMGSSQ